MSRVTATDPGPDDLMTLKEACSRVFDGAFKVSTLRAEHQRGRLTIYKIGRRHFTTLRDLQEMKKKCLVAQKERASISTRNANSGQSETERLSSALVALNQTTQALKGSSPNTSPGSTDRRRARHQ